MDQEWLKWLPKAPAVGQELFGGFYGGKPKELDWSSLVAA